MEGDQPIPEALQEAGRSLPTIYGDPTHYDVLAQMTAPDDLPFYRGLVEAYGGPVLELGAGTGRVLLALAELGVECVGVELSPAMLELARQKAEAAELGVTLALGDLRRFELGRTFPLILLTYNTLNHLLDDRSLSDALATAKAHMDASSRLVIDTFHPSLAFLGAPPAAKPILRYIDPYLREEVRITEDNEYDPTRQINRITWRYTIGETPEARVETLDMRIFFPRELDALLRLHGLELEAKHGDYDGQPFGPESPKQLCVCRLADGGPA